MNRIFLGFILLVSIFDGCATMIRTNQEKIVMASGTSVPVQEFSIPTGAELLESTEFKDNGIPYVIERRYRLPSGEILYAYYDVEGGNSITIQKIEQPSLFTLGTDINIPGMPGYREFNFGDDRRKLVQFMKLFKLGQKAYSGKVKTPSLGDSIFTPSLDWRSEFKLLLDFMMKLGC